MTIESDDRVGWRKGGGVEDNQIIFGIGNKGLIRKIPNTDENIRLIKYLNGELDRQSLGLSDDKLKRKISILRNLGLITVNDYNPNRKYSRNYNFFEWMDLSSNVDPEIYQKRLEKSYVIIFGLGGIGSGVAQELVRAGVKKLKLVDFDLIESSNLTRQSAYIQKDIGSKKTEACKKYLQYINPNVEVTTAECKINNSADIEKNIEPTINLIVNCMDKPDQLDSWFDEVSNRVNKPVIFSSYASTAANVFVKIPNTTVNYSDFLDKEQITDKCIIDNSYPTAAISSVTSMAAGMSSFNAIMLLTGLRTPTNAIQIDFDGWNILKLDVKSKNII